MELDDIQRQLDKLTNEMNNKVRPDFEGYSPFEMHLIIDFPFSPSCPIQLNRLEEADLKMIPMLNQVKYLAQLIAEKGELKLTDKGFLPTKIVADIYQQGFLKDEEIEMGIQRLYKERDAPSVHLTRILIEISGLVKKRNGKYSLTKEGMKTLADDNDLLRLILITMAGRFNWAYFDRYGDNRVGQLGYAFTLILLSKYGAERRLDTFYSDKYLKAYPLLLESVNPRYSTKEDQGSRCYSLRTFNRFLDHFGLINIEEEKIKGDYFATKKYVSKTVLFDKLFKVKPHEIMS